jgi:predicted dehydrogenase
MSASHSARPVRSSRLSLRSHASQVHEAKYVVSRPGAATEEVSRVECEGSAAVLDRDHTVRVEERSAAGTLQTREVPPVEIIWDGHQAVAAEFLDWLDGGPPPATTLVDNLQSTAMLFAAIRAAETGMTVDVQEMVRQLAPFL